MTTHYDKRWNVTVPEKLAEPLHWRTPRRVFVNSTSDLFHEDVPDEFIAAVFGVMAACPQHTFQILTKRPERMAKWFEWFHARLMAERFMSPLYTMSEFIAVVPGYETHEVHDAIFRVADVINALREGTPLPNVWLGTSVEDQRRADERIPHLLRVPAAVRFLSVEPMLGPVDIGRLHQWCPTHDFAGGFCSSPCADVRSVDWVIVGGESGPGARPFDLAWARSLVRQCADAGVACFVKQLGARPVTSTPEHPADAPCVVDHDGTVGLFDLVSRKGGDPAEWPADLRVREFPVTP